MTRNEEARSKRRKGNKIRWLFNPWAWNVSRRTHEEKIDKKIINKHTKIKNAFSEKKDRIKHKHRLTEETTGSQPKKKIKLEPIKKESNDEIKFTPLHLRDRLKRQDKKVKRRRKRW